MITIQEAIQQFDRDAHSDHLDAGERERAAMLEHFPIGRWQTMTLEEYALGQSRPSESVYSWWIEFGTKHLGNIGGATAIKHMIFYHSDGYWKFLSAYSSEEEAWSAIHNEFLRIFELAEAQEWEKMDEENLFHRGGRTKLKSLHLYFPEEILPIVSPQHMKHFLILLGAAEEDLRKLSSLRLNRLLLEQLRQQIGSQSLSTLELMHLLYNWNDPRNSEEITTYAEKRRETQEDNKPAPSVLFLSIADALERKGQAILHGPPGTGKTYHALRFAKWWLGLEDDQDVEAIPTPKKPQRVWWVVANPKQWHWEELFRDGQIDYKYGRLKRNYPLVQPGDLVVGYLAAPEKKIVALAKVSKGLHEVDGEPRITLEPVQRIQDGLTYAELTEDPTLSKSEPIYNRCQGTLFKLDPDEAEYLLFALADRNPEMEEYLNPKDTNTDAERHTLVTFHPSYSYEDFIEGFRPVDTGDGLRLRLSDGLFKTMCISAQANPSQKYLIIIDEINRANLAKVFGEIITLLERDKRNTSVMLPQSKESFSVPENVYMLGTMNTSDRSIRLLDAALRRRFSFLEIMPNLDLLLDEQIDGILDLREFMNVLNTRISRVQGREKQIGHAFFLENGKPVSDTTEFANRFRQEILPLLQEYCYDDYAELAEYIGRDLVDIENATLRAETLLDDEQLVEALANFISKVPSTD